MVANQADAATEAIGYFGIGKAGHAHKQDNFSVQMRQGPEDALNFKDALGGRLPRFAAQNCGAAKRAVTFEQGFGKDLVLLEAFITRLNIKRGIDGIYAQGRRGAGGITAIGGALLRNEEDPLAQAGFACIGKRCDARAGARNHFLAKLGSAPNSFRL